MEELHYNEPVTPTESTPVAPVGPECHAKRSLKYVKFSIILGFLLLLIAVLSFGIFSKNLIKNVQESKKHINTLIDEVGEVKEKNMVITQKVSEGYKEIEKSLANLKTADSIELEENLKKAAEAEKEITKAVQTVNVRAVTDSNELDFLLVGHNYGLTDTIILASVNPKKETITMVSIPRDLYIGGRKINEYFEFYGIEKLVEEVAKVTGIKAEKYAVTDMKTFSKMIDLIGGVDITVAEDIYDPYFPNGVGYYQTYYVEKGDHHMDGTEALKYARSRKTTSDFDRNERQQQLLTAVKTKFIDSNYMENAKGLVDIYASIITDLETNIDVLESVTYLKKFQNYNFEIGNGLNTSNYLYPTFTEGGAYILLPKAGDFGEVKGYIEGLVQE
ncbi:MAG: LCP family protein [Patescibacteria group bacterium]|nr:LCP family protein [Patescibacteria group bacterium]